MSRSALRRSTSSLAGVLVLLFLLVGLAAPAGAHAELVSTSPASGSTAESPPARVELRFSEGVDPVPGAVRLLRSDGDGNGEDIDADVGRIDGDGATVQLVPAAALADGAYVVAWRVTSADSHPVRGAFTFQVGAGGAAIDGAGTGALVNRLLAEQQGSRGAGAVESAGRWLSFAGVALSVGWLLFAALSIGGPATGWAREVRLAAAAGALGTLVMAGGQAVSLASSWRGIVDPGAYGDVFATESGGWWAARLVLLAALAVLAPVLLRPRTVARGIAAGVAIGLAWITALGGHGASGRWPAVGMTATAAHLLALGVWAAGLVTLVGGWVGARRSGAGRGPGDRFAARFSSIALVAVAVLAISGAANGVRQVGEVDLLWSTDYGRLLVIKVALVAAAVGIAVLSRRLVHQGRFAALRVPVGAELGFVVVASVVTALLVNQRPAISERTAIASATAVVGQRSAQVVLDPARTSDASLHVYLSSPNGALDRASDIVVTASLPVADVGPLPLEVFDAGPNHVTNPSLDLPLAGTWTITVTARYGEFDQVTYETTLDVRR